MHKAPAHSIRPGKTGQETMLTRHYPRQGEDALALLLYFCLLSLPPGDPLVKKNFIFFLCFRPFLARKFARGNTICVKNVVEWRIRE